MKRTVSNAATGSPAMTADTSGLDDAIPQGDTALPPGPSATTAADVAIDPTNPQHIIAVSNGLTSDSFFAPYVMPATMPPTFAITSAW